MPAVRQQKGGMLWLSIEGVEAKALISGDVRELAMSVHRSDPSNSETLKVCAISIHYIQMYCSISFCIYIYTVNYPIHYSNINQNQTWKIILVVSTIFFRKQ